VAVLEAEDTIGGGDNLRITERHSLKLSVK
jgi:hypothetical protein